MGAGSGLDLASLVDQLVGAERQSREGPLNLAEARVLSQLSAFGQVKGAVSSFQDTLEPLQDLTAYRGRTASVENEEAFTATADTNAATGSFAIEVLSLAAAQKVRTDPFESSIDAIGTGTITISNGEESFSVVIDEDSGSLADIRDAINSSAENTLVTAGIVNSVDGAHLILTGSKPGEAGAFTISVDGGDGGLDSLAYAADESPSAFVQVTAAADAQLRVDGLDVTATSNTVTEAIDGVTIDLLAAEAGELYSLEVDFNRDSAKERIQTFVQGYNNVLLTVGNQTTFNAETFQAGALFGDSSIRSLVTDVRGVATSLDPNQSLAVRSLAQIGIATEIDGSLSIDTELLDAAIEQNFEEVGSLFAGEDGLVSKLDTLLGTYLEPTGRLSTRTDSLESQVEDYSERRDALELRMETFELRIRSQFTALDGLISELNNTSTFLAQQLDNLPGSGAN